MTVAKFAAAVYIITLLSAPTLTASALVLFAPNNSVRSRSIVNGAVKTVDLANRAVTSAKVKDGTVTDSDIAAAASISASKINTSTLNADLLDNKHASDLADAAHNHNATYVNDDANEIDNNDISNGAIAAAKIAGTAWTSANDGAGSGLDADILDGVHAADFVGISGDSTVAGSLAASDLRYTGTKTDYAAIVGSALIPEQSEYPYDVYNGSIWSTTSTTGYFEAPVTLPNGVLVTNFRYVAWDADAADSNAQLMRHTTAADGSMASATTAGTPGTTQVDDSSISYADIDNSQYSYYVRTSLVNGTTLEAMMFIITYTYTSPGG